MIGTGIGLGLSGYRLKTGPSAIPESIAGLQLWLDAADSSTLYQTSGGSIASVDGDPVGEWLDKSGNARHANQASGTNKPALKTGIKNGNNAIRFDGTNDFMVFNSIASNPFSIFLVKKSITLANYRQWIGADPYNAPFYAYAEGLTQRLFFGAVDSTAPTTNWELCTITRNGASGLFYLNNGSSISFTAGSGTLTPAYLGSKTGPSEFINADIAELIIYNRLVSNPEKDKVVSYLNDKWGVY